MYTFFIALRHSIGHSCIVWLGIIHLLRLQNFPKKEHFLPPDTNTFVCVSEGKKC